MSRKKGLALILRDGVLYDPSTGDSFGTTTTGTWGAISGTLSTQTDVQAALDAKAALSHTHAESDVTSLVADLALRVQIGGDLGGTPTVPRISLARTFLLMGA